MDEVKDFLKSRTFCNLFIIFVNIAVFLIMEIIGDTEDVEFMLRHGASYTPWIVGYKEYYRLVTCIFLHFGLDHLFNNMFALMFLGDGLERAVGKVRYLMIYLGGGILANVLSCALEYRTMDFSVSAGASGAVFAVIGALVYIVVVNRGRVDEFTGKRLVLMAALTLFEGFTSTGVDNAAHVGGFVFGLLFAVLLYKKPRQSRRESSWYY